MMPLKANCRILSTLALTTTTTTTTATTTTTTTTTTTGLHLSAQRSGLRKPSPNPNPQSNPPNRFLFMYRSRPVRTDEEEIPDGPPFTETQLAAFLKARQEVPPDHPNYWEEVGSSS